MWIATPSSQWTCTIYLLPVSRRTEALNHVGDLVYSHFGITLSVVTAVLVVAGIVASGLSNRAHRRRIEARRKSEDDARNLDA